MTLDAAINILKSDNDYNKSIGCNTSYEEQLIEWLEDYKRIKMLIPIEQALKAEYNKAIDDFVKFANTFPTVEEEDGTIRPMWLEEMAKQLKAGVKNEN